MPRRPRIVVPNIPLHIIQRGNNKQACFFIDDIEYNPGPGAGLAKRPEDWKWSSIGAHVDYG